MSPNTTADGDSRPPRCGIRLRAFAAQRTQGSRRLARRRSARDAGTADAAGSDIRRRRRVRGPILAGFIADSKDPPWTRGADAGFAAASDSALDGLRELHPAEGSELGLPAPVASVPRPRPRLAVGCLARPGCWPLLARAAAAPPLAADARGRHRQGPARRLAGGVQAAAARRQERDLRAGAERHRRGPQQRRPHRLFPEVLRRQARAARVRAARRAAAARPRPQDRRQGRGPRAVRALPQRSPATRRWWWRTS